MKQLGLNYPCQKTKVFIAQAVNQLKSVTNNVLIHMLLQIQVSFCEKQKIKASGQELQRFGENTLNCGSRKSKRFFEGFLRTFWLVYPAYTF